eukprot:4583345-Amphidinium_carterae.1
MRNRRNFQAASEEVMSDLVFVNEQLTAPPPSWTSAASSATPRVQYDDRQLTQQHRRSKGAPASKGKGQ